MSKYRKKPVEIEAWHFDPQIREESWTHEAPPDWLTNHESKPVFTVDVDGCPIILIETLEGIHQATRGDWIIMGVKGEIYPCKPDIFKATYDPVA